MKDSSKKPKKTKILLPSAESIKEQKKSLLVFPPINLRTLFDKRQLSKTFSPAEEAMLLLTLKDQSETLLESLGVEVGTADCWERGFQILARLHHGAGQVEVGFPKQNAKTWTLTHDRLLCAMVNDLTQNGISANQALVQIAKTPSKWKRFPIPEKSKLDRPETDLRIQRLQSRWKTHAKKWTALLTLEQAPGSLDSPGNAVPPPLKLGKLS